MTNYEIFTYPIPDPKSGENMEKWLENASKYGGELVTVIPTSSTGHVMYVFRVQNKGNIGAPNLEE